VNLIADFFETKRRGRAKRRLGKNFLAGAFGVLANFSAHPFFCFRECRKSIPLSSKQTVRRANAATLIGATFQSVPLGKDKLSNLTRPASE
jgi:hypothetical protein